MSPDSNLLPSIGFTLPRVGEDHPLRKRFRRTFLWSATIAMLISAVVAGGQIAISRYMVSRIVPIVIPTPGITVDVIPPPEITADVVSGPSFATQVRPEDAISPEPVPDYEATDLIDPSPGRDAAPSDATSFAGADGGDFRAAASGDEWMPSPDEYVAVEQLPQLLNGAEVQRATADLYPDIAKSAGVEGTVNLRVCVGKTGDVEKILVVDGPEMLRDAAKQAVQRAKFKPALQQHHPVAIWVAWALEFSLGS